MHRNKTLRYTMFGSLYFTQGTVLSYFTALNALYFLSRGLNMTDVGVFGAIALVPFVIKIFLGMLSDRVNLFGWGHRKPYILIGLLVQLACLVVVPFVDPADSYWGFVALAFTLQMGMALYDTCTDGLALDTTPPEEQGTIQGFMVGGRALAIVLTASILGILADKVSWTAVFWLLAVLTLIPIPLVLTAKEAERTAGEEFDWGAFSAFKGKGVIFLSLLGFIFFFIIAGANQMVNPFLEMEFGISFSQAGVYTTVFGIGAVLGGIFGGRIYGRIGMRNATLAAMGVGLAGTLLLGLTGGPGMAWLLVGLFGLAYGTQQTIFFALAMKHTVPHIAASMYAILMAVTNVAQGAGMAVSGILADSAGFRITFVILGLLNLLILPLLSTIFGRDSA